MNPPPDPNSLNQTEQIDDQLLDLDLRDDHSILSTLAHSQKLGTQAAEQAIPELANAVTAASQRLASPTGRLIMVGAGASGRLAVQDGAELWPTYGWPAERLVLQIAGGTEALLHSIEGVEDDHTNATTQVGTLKLTQNDVVLALAASGSSPWTVSWVKQARLHNALTIGMANNADTPLLMASEHPILLNSGEEVLAGSTRMAAGTAQKVALNMFSTLLMMRLNRTYGNLMVDMAATNAKLDKRRLRMLHTLIPTLEDAAAIQALSDANGWVKLAALLCLGLNRPDALELLNTHSGNLRAAMADIQGLTID